MPSPSAVLELRSVLGTGGGPDKTILLGSQILAGSKYPTILCYIRDARDPVFTIGERLKTAPIEYIEIRERHSFDWRVWRPLQRIVRERSIRIVHAHDYKTDLLALLLARANGAIPLSTVHGWSGHSWKERRLYYPADRWLLRKYPRVITVSSDMRAELIRRGADPARITVILNGVDPTEYRRRPELETVARAEFGVPAGALVVGAIGRLEREKNYPLLANAFAVAAAEYPNALLLIAGEGSEREVIANEIARLGLKERCRLLGQVADIRLLHHALDVVVQSSDNEGTPNAILEAMAMNTPIVATDVGGTSEVARPNREALIVARRDTDGIARAIVNVLRDPTGAAARASAARARVETDLSFEARMRHVERVYDELILEFPLRDQCANS